MNGKPQFSSSNVFWWKPRPRFKVFPRPHNLGDALSPFIVRKVLEELKPDGGVPDESKKLFAIGSILNHAHTGDVVWGSGVNGKKSISSHEFSELDVRAVRGPNTKKFLEGMGVKTPDVFGDPGVLISRYIKPDVVQDRSELFIPHFSEGRVRRPGIDTVHTIGEDFRSFANEICRSEIVYSSSLHGLIIAESYGIKAILTEIAPTENIFKYEDYYLGTGRSVFPVASSIEEARGMVPPELPDVEAVQNRLLEAFPLDLWR